MARQSKVDQLQAKRITAKHSKAKQSKANHTVHQSVPSIESSLSRAAYLLSSKPIYVAPNNNATHVGGEGGGVYENVVDPAPLYSRNSGSAGGGCGIIGSVVSFLA